MFCIVLYCFVLFCILLYSFVLSCSVSIALYHVVIYCVNLYLKKIREKLAPVNPDLFSENKESFSFHWNVC